MDYVILGFLMIRSLTQYDILQALSKGVSPFYAASLGSIQAACKKLVTSEYADVEKTRENGRRKNIYHITDLGREAFAAWMMSGEIEAGRKNDMAISTRLFFLGLMTLDERQQIIKNIATFLDETVREYTAAYEEYQSIDVPDKFVDVARYQLKTLELGIDQYRATLEWFNSLAKELEVEE